MAFGEREGELGRMNGGLFKAVEHLETVILGKEASYTTFCDHIAFVGGANEDSRIRLESVGDDVDGEWAVCFDRFVPGQQAAAEFVSMIQATQADMEEESQIDYEKIWKKGGPSKFLRDATSTQPFLHRHVSQSIATNRSECIVYSFGIADDWSFDEALAAMGCRVFSFDPSIGLPMHQHMDRVWFEPTGLSKEDADDVHGFEMASREEQLWHTRTLGSLMSRHQHLHIDILKIDIEGDEWGAVEQAIDSGALRNVSQLLFEIHLWDPAWDADTRERALRYCGAQPDPETCTPELVNS